MKNKIFCNKFLVMLLAFFSPMIINIGGEVSPSLLFIVATSPLWIKNLNFKAKTPFRYILHLLLALVAVQIVWAMFAVTPLMDQVKGILIVVSGIFYFMYYYMVYSYNKEVVKWAVLGSFLASFVFINVLADIAGGEFGFWKFQVMPRIVTMCVLIYLWGSKNKYVVKTAPILFILVGGLGLATGARSTGLGPFLAGTITIVLQLKKRVDLSQIKKYLLIGCCLLYAAYALVYVPNVMNGNISAGNTEQLKSMDNPYNPLALLMIGRADSVIPFLAFLDKPLAGWGYFTPDPHLKYHKMQLAMLDEGDVDVTSLDAIQIPGHSGWGYLSCSYGILGFLICFLLVKKALSCVFKSLVVHDRYLLYRIFITIGFLWNFLFSPLAHFKTLPSVIAAILVFSMPALRGSQNKEHVYNGIKRIKKE